VRSGSGRYQVVATWMGNCLRIGKSSRYITNVQVNSAFHPSEVGKSSTDLSGWRVYPHCVADKTA